MSEWETVSKSTNDEWETISSDWETVSPSSQQQEPSKLSGFGDSILNTGKTIASGILSNLNPQLAKGLGIEDPTLGIKEVGANLATGILPGPVGGLMGLGNELVKSVVTGEPIKSAENAYVEGMNALTYQPKTEQAQTIMEKVVHPVISNLMAIAPLAEMQVLGHSMQKPTGKISREPIKQEPVLQPSNKLFAEEGLKIVESRISNIRDKINQMVEDGIDVKRDTPILEALDAELKQLEGHQQDLVGITKGETKQEALDRAERQIQKLQELRASKPQTYDVGSEITPEQLHTQRLNQLNEDVAIRQAQDQGPTIPEAIQDPTGYVNKVAAEQAVPKTTPQEVALTKIGEAMNMERGELGDRILDTQDKLDAIPDTPENSSIRENLAAEIKAYESIQKGEQPDLSWFEGNREAPTTEGITVEEIPEVQVTSPDPVFTRVTDIFDHQGDTLHHLVNNRDAFFDRAGTSQVFFDKNFGVSEFGKKSVAIIQTILNKTGLFKDNIYITLEENFNSGGRLNHFDDTTVIRVNKAKLDEYIKAFDQTPELFKGIAAKNLDQAKLVYATTRVVAHEVGHAWLHKYFKHVVGDSSKIGELVSKFNKSIVKDGIDNVSPIDYYGGEITAQKFRALQKHFHEYVAERVTKQLLGDQDLLAGFKKDRVKTLKSVFDAGYEMLRKLYAKGGEVFLNKKKFFDDEIAFFIKANEDYVKYTAQTIWEANERAVNDGNLPTGDLYHMTMQQILEHPEVQKLIPSKQGERIFLGLDTNDAPTTSMRVFRDLGRGAMTFGKEFFNRNNVVDMNPKDQLVRNSYVKQREFDIQVETMQNDLWYDQSVPKDVKFWQVLSKVKDATSPYVVLLKSNKQDKFALHELFKKGFEEGLDYADNLAKNGGHLSPDQVKYYNTLSKLFKKMYDYSTKTQDALGKKWVISERAGWYPAVRSGQYTVQINYGDLTVRAQSFSTKLQAEKFRDRLKNDPRTNRFEISDIIDKKDKQAVFTNREAVDAIVDKFSRLVPQHRDFFAGEGRKVLDAMATRGGKLGFHHEFRENLPGYKGNELFITPDELGESFGMAIEAAIAEKGMQIKEMLYKTEFNPILENPDLIKSKPNSIAAIQTMVDSALGRHEPMTGVIGDNISHTVDKVADSVLQWFGSEKTGDTSVVRMSVDNIRETFYLLKMMPKVVFSMIGQVVGTPAMTVAKMSYETPLKSYTTFAKGVLKLTSGNTELWNVLKEVSQRTDTFEPQFVESLTLKKHDKAFVKAIKDWVLLQAPGKGSESLSRIISFSAFYEHYKDLGMPREKAIDMAIIKTGETLNLYDKANSAPIFSHLGPVGEAIKPLQGFGQNMLGNIIGMTKIAGKNPAPLINFTLITIAMSGVMGLPFIQDYEKYRLAQAKKGDYSLPSILDIVASRNDALDSIIPADVRTLGLPAATGYDLASSTRANQSLFTLAAGVLLGNGHPLDMMPLTDWAMSVPGAVGTMGKGMMGEPKSASEMAKAVDVLAPSGHLGYGVKEVMNLNTTRLEGTPTNQRMIGAEGGSAGKRTDQDIYAGMLGTKTSKARMEELVNYDIQEKEKGRSAQIDKAGILLAETGDRKYLQRMIDLGATQEQIVNKIGLEQFNRLVPLTIRQMMNKNGKLVSGRGERAAQGLFKFGMLK